MKLEAFRCQGCAGIALVDSEKHPPNVDLPCPYCFNNPHANMGDMVPIPRTLIYPDDFVSTVLIGRDDSEKES